MKKWTKIASYVAMLCVIVGGLALVKKFAYREFDKRIARIHVGQSQDEVLSIMSEAPLERLTAPYPDDYHGYDFPSSDEATEIYIYSRINELFFIYFDSSNLVIKHHLART